MPWIKIYLARDLSLIIVRNDNRNDVFSKEKYTQQECRTYSVNIVRTVEISYTQQNVVYIAERRIA